MLQAHGNKVARLPPHQCELNANEFSITAEDWQKQCEHVHHIEDKFCERDACMDTAMDRFIIELNAESDTESDSSYDDSSDCDYLS
ncbi:unnamed protein product [Leptidea sinapis]|uniref:Uncharacterized protein n=1 Tax=Leptidea sinapis TaxID=189913 RepID=A0A5E4PPE1_9NEOP|nr:unnamed protein product [Leptidea sinapis]